jgi:succinoglycan biosynthesis transport protein ExoP
MAGAMIDARDLARPIGGAAAGAGEPTLLRIVLRQKWKILAFAVAMCGLALLVIRVLPVRYTATAAVALDARQLQVLASAQVMSVPQLDLDRLRTQMEGFHSPRIAEAVVQQLDLTRNPSFCPPPAPDWTGWLSRRAEPSAVPAACNISPEKAAKQLAAMVSVTNDGRSYIVWVQAEAGDPQLAATIANAYARAYVTEQRNTNSADMQLADDWLGAYLAKLREQTQGADAAVARYREQHHLTPLRGETVVTQSLAELNTQLTLATSALADKQSLLRQVQGLAHGGAGLDASAPALASPVIQNLLEKEATLGASQADLESRYGAAYPQVKAGAAQIGRLRQQIHAEVTKAVSGLTGEVAALTARKAALAANVQYLQEHAAQQNHEDVQLQELKRDADADRQLYQTMLIRLKEIDAEQGMQRADAHLVVEARPPDLASFPRVKMMLAGAFLAALGIGSGIAVGGSLLSRRFRDVDQVELETGLPVLGLFPRPDRRSVAHDMVVDRPMSLEAEALHAILIGLSRRNADEASPRGHTIMVVSALPGEGKSSFALALGRSAASASLSVALLDCDLRLPSLRRLVCGSEPESGDVKTVDARSGLHVIRIASAVRNPHHLLAQGLGVVVDRLRAQYDLIILDTPPVLAVPDALTLGPLADDVLLLASWQETPRSVVGAAVERMRRNAIDISGIVLTKVDLRTFKRAGGGHGYYATQYRGHADASGLTDAAA